MGIYGVGGLLVAFAGIVVSLVCLIVGMIMQKKSPSNSNADTMVWGGHIATVLTFIALTFCCGLLIYCFLSGDNTIQYVVEGRSHADGVLGTFYRISGLWEGREGSLLFWAWLISLFSMIIALRRQKELARIDSVAIVVIELVLFSFVALLMFSESNSPFTATPTQYLNSDGSLNAAGSVLGMNPLLEHWAMAVHPPALFTGYAGMTVPFAYAIAAVVTNDSSTTWVTRCQRYLMVSWVFLSIGIGLGALWAYVVLGWGGYWGWDAVENASLLPWLVGLALIHSLTVYRNRGAFKRWSIMCACLAFTFVIVGTFITRSGIVQSVHSFASDQVSLVLFGALIIISFAMGVIGVIWRRKTFAAEHDEDEEIENFFSRDAAYYFNNVVLIIITFLIFYLTISSALPTWLPFGGNAVSAGTYNAIARPLGVFYCLILAVCPLLGWRATNKAAFWKKAKIPGICAAVLFVVLLVLFVTQMAPNYYATLAQGGTNADGLASEGPVGYYMGLAIVGLAVASLIFFNTLFMIGRNSSSWGRAHHTNAFVAFFKMVPKHANTYGGYLAHLGIAVILVGLIGSAMFDYDQSQYLAFDENANTAEDMQVQNYTLHYTGNDIQQNQDTYQVLYTVDFDVYENGQYIGSVSPSVQLNAMTQQTKSNAAIIGQPTQDIFIVYRGTSNTGALSIDVRLNPMIRFVWGGFFILLAGAIIAAVGHRGKSDTSSDVNSDESSAPSSQGDSGSTTKDKAKDDAKSSTKKSAKNTSSGSEKGDKTKRTSGGKAKRTAKAKA